MTEEQGAPQTGSDSMAKSASFKKPQEKRPELVERPGSASGAAEVKAFVAEDSTSDLDRQPTEPVSGIMQRRSRWYSSLAALRYVSSLSKDDDVRVRDSDRSTSIFLLISATLTVLSLVIQPLAPHRLAFVLVCDVLVGVMLVFYVANRFGILNTLTPRQALLSWQLMMGASFLGIFMTINLAVVIALVVARTAIDAH